MEPASPLLSWMVIRYIPAGKQLSRLLAFVDEYLVLVDPSKRHTTMKKPLKSITSASFDQKSSALFRIIFSDGDVVILISEKRAEILKALDHFIRFQSIEAVLTDQEPDYGSVCFHVKAVDRFGNLHSHWLKLDPEYVLHIDQGSGRVLLKHKYDQISDFEKTGDKYSIKYEMEKGYHFFIENEEDIHAMVSLISSRIYVQRQRDSRAIESEEIFDDTDNQVQLDEEILPYKQSEEKERNLIETINRGFPPTMRSTEPLFPPQTRRMDPPVTVQLDTMESDDENPESKPRSTSKSKEFMNEPVDTNPRHASNLNKIGSPFSDSRESNLNSSDSTEYSVHQSPMVSADATMQTLVTCEIAVQSESTSQRNQRAPQQRQHAEIEIQTEEDFSSSESFDVTGDSSNDGVTTQDAQMNTKRAESRKPALINTSSSFTGMDSIEKVESSTMTTPRADRLTEYEDRTKPSSPINPLTQGKHVDGNEPQRKSPINRQTPPSIDNTGTQLSVAQISSTLARGSYLYKHVKNGQKKPHRRFFVYDSNTKILRWSKKEDNKKKKKFMVIRLESTIRPDIQQHQPLFCLANSTKSFTLYSHDRQLDLAAENEVMYRAWTEGIKLSLQS